VEALEALLRADQPGYPLPDRVAALYPGGLGFAPRVLYSNFVGSLDGVVALGDGRNAGSVISGRNPGDRFLMGLLRACADAVVIGAGTLRATPEHLWTAEHIHPDLAEDWAELRHRLGRAPRPRLALLTAGGHLDPTHPAIRAGALVLTTEAGAARLAGALPDTCRVEVAGAAGEGAGAPATGSVDAAAALAAIHAEGHQVVLTEGGPAVMGQLLRARLLDEMFLTVSPVVAGREAEGADPAEPRPGFASGVELLPDHPEWWSLSTVHRHRDHLFLRYRTPRA
jgi:riboflavin biosynthesis pyrimidine reductase